MAKRTLSYREVAALAESVGLPGKTFAQIAKGESGYQVGAVGHDPGGTKGLGLWQITTKYNDDIIAKHGGAKKLLTDPVANARAAKDIYDRQGIKAWYGTKYVTSPNAHYKGKAPKVSRRATPSPQQSVGSGAQDNTALALSLLGGDSMDPLQMALTAALQSTPQSPNSPSPRPSAPQSRVGSQPNPGLYKLAKIAQNKFGLSVREFAPFDKVDPVHTKGSFHYSNKAMDVSGDPARMAAFNKYVARKHGKWVAEMFHDPGINLDNGKRTGAIGGHGSHVHVAVK